jgi:hypothetical protein
MGDKGLEDIDAGESLAGHLSSAVVIHQSDENRKETAS